MEKLGILVRELLKLPTETEWVEFKQNNSKPDEIGEYISALSNSATYHDKNHAYLIWGVKNDTHEIVGTSFDYRTSKIGQEELENWLRRSLTDSANFVFHTVELNNKRIVLLIILKAIYQTVKFKNIAYIRVGSYKKSLKDYPAIEVQLWSKLNGAKFEKLHSKSDLNKTEVLRELDFDSYFSLTQTPLPANEDAILHYLLQDGLAVKQDNSLYAITNLGAILFARRLENFEGLSRKRIRVIQYQGKNRVKTLREDIESRGYASGFEGLLKYTESLLPFKEEISGALRKTISVYPPIALRELIANALIHQDLAISGSGPTIEIFESRIEITNPGTPLIDTWRFIDNPPKSRNEMLAALMRRTNICEERGSGWDKIAMFCEIFQLPAPKIEIFNDSIRVTVYSHIPFKRLSQTEKQWSCYTHACLKQVSGEQLTNTSLRERFGLESSNKASVSRLIASTVKADLIKPLDPTTAPRHMCYVPFWA